MAATISVTGYTQFIRDGMHSVVSENLQLNAKPIIKISVTRQHSSVVNYGSPLVLIIMNVINNSVRVIHIGGTEFIVLFSFRNDDGYLQAPASAFAASLLTDIPLNT